MTIYRLLWLDSYTFYRCRAGGLILYQTWKRTNYVNRCRQSGRCDDIVEYIKDLQYGDIDYVVATHPHDDHIGGMAEVLKTFLVEKMYVPNAVHISYSFENLLNVIEEKTLT